MSFGFRVTRQDWSTDWTERSIAEVDLHKGDVSIVNFGANPATGGLVALRSAELALAVGELRSGELTPEKLDTLFRLIPELAAMAVTLDSGQHPADAGSSDLSLFDARLRALDL